MKQLFSKILIITILMMTTVSCSGQKFFADVPSGVGISKIILNKTLLTLTKPLYLDALKEDGVNKAIQSIDHIEIVSCENTSKIKEVRTICENVVNAAGYEPALVIEDGDEQTTIYTSPTKDGSTIFKGMILLVSEPKEYTAICLKGKFDLSKLDMGDDNSSDK